MEGFMMKFLSWLFVSGSCVCGFANGSGRAFDSSPELAALGTGAREWKDVRVVQEENHGEPLLAEWIERDGAYVALGTSPAGTHRIVLPPRTPPVTISRRLPQVSQGGELVLDWFIRPAIGSTEESASAIVAHDALLLFDEVGGEGRVQWWDGPGGGEWRDSGYRFPLTRTKHQSKEWLRVTLIVEDQFFSLLVNGQVVSDKLPLDTLSMKRAPVKFSVHGSTVGEVWLSDLIVAAADDLLGQGRHSAVDAASDKLTLDGSKRSESPVYADIHQLNRERVAVLMRGVRPNDRFETHRLLVFTPLERTSQGSKQ